MTLQDALTWIITGGGASYLAFWLAEHWPWAQGLPSEHKRLVSFALAGALGIVAYLGCIGMAFAETPPDWRAWIAVLFESAAAAIIGGQIVHGRAVLAKK